MVPSRTTTHHILANRIQFRLTSECNNVSSAGNPARLLHVYFNEVIHEMRNYAHVKFRTSNKKKALSLSVMLSKIHKSVTQADVTFTDGPSSSCCLHNIIKLINLINYSQSFVGNYPFKCRIADQTDRLRPCNGK